MKVDFDNTDIDRVMVSYIPAVKRYIVSPLHDGLRLRHLQWAKNTEPTSQELYDMYGKHIVIDRITLDKVGTWAN